MNINSVTIVGRVTKNPELKTIPSGQSVANFSIATNRMWTDKSGKKQEEVEFHNIVAWGKTAEIAGQYMVKGALVGVQGSLKTRSWEDKEGKKHYATEIVCERLQLGPKPTGAAKVGAPAPEPEEEVFASAPSEEEINPNDLPF